MLRPPFLAPPSQPSQVRWAMYEAILTEARLLLRSGRYVSPPSDTLDRSVPLPPSLLCRPAGGAMNCLVAYTLNYEGAFTPIRRRHVPAKEGIRASSNEMCLLCEYNRSGVASCEAQFLPSFLNVSGFRCDFVAFLSGGSSPVQS